MQTFNEYKQNIKILYVEDDKRASKKLLKILGNHFRNIVLANNGEEALDIYKNSFSTSPIDLVITDINMPKMDGISLLEIIRDFDNDLPFIYVSAVLDTKTLLKLIKLEIINFIQKPIDVEELLNSIHKVILSKYKSNFYNQNYKENIINLSNKIYWNNDSKTLIINNIEQKLTKSEILLLNFFANNLNKVFTAEQIIDSIWNEIIDESKNANLKNLISRLRIKIPEIKIENIYGLGYKIKV